MILGLLDAIEAADLPVAVYRTAVRLARLADDHGQAAMSWDEFQALTGCGHQDAARRHLRQMQAAGLIDWHGGRVVVVTWCVDAQLLRENRQLLSENAQYLRVDNNEANGTAQQVSENAQLLSENRHLLRVDNNGNGADAQVVSENRQQVRVDNNHDATDAQLLSENAQLLRGENGDRAATARKQAASVGKQAATARSSHTRTHARALDVCLIDPSDPGTDPSTNQTNNQTNNQTPAREDATDGDASRGAALLRDIGVAPDVADALATRHDFAFVRRAVAHWYTKRKEAGGSYDNHPGIVVYWLNNPEKAGLPRVLPSAWFYTELGQAYADPSDGDFDDLPPVPTRRPPRPAPERDLAPLDATWRVVQMEVLASYPPGSDARRWLAGSRLVEAEPVDGVPLYQVQLASPEGESWVLNRLAVPIRRALKSLLGKAVLVEVTAPEMAVAA